MGQPAAQTFALHMYRVPACYLPFLFAGVLLFSAGQAQIPTKCFEIESILVDACISATDCPGSQEGQNEMVRFRTGPDPIALADIVVDWPNNTWRGFVQDASTAALTATLNATIESCGFLLEPTAGVIPPGSGVLMVTSTAMCTPANPFTNLGDTLYLVFQQPGNTAGHFANHTNGGTVSPVPTSASALRTLVMIHLPTACGDTATYDRAELVNIYGTYGGVAAENDGSTAEFSWPGIPVVSYVNFGCQAPIVPVSVAVVVDGDLCGGSAVDLEAVVSGSFTSLAWTGGTGTFSDPTGAITSYTAGAGDVGTVQITVCALGACADPVCASVEVPVGNAPLVEIGSSGPLTLCPGETLVLTAIGADTYSWSTGQNGPSITVSSPGTYNVTGSNICGASSASVTVGTSSGPQVSIAGDISPCMGTTTVLTASGADSYSWSSGESTAAITVSEDGTYTVTGTTDCGSAQASITVSFVETPTVSVTSSGSLCPDALLTATGADDYSWSNGATGASITVDSPGTYTVTGSTACGQDIASITVEASDLSASFQGNTTVGDAPLLVQFTNTSQPASGNYFWEFGDGGTSSAVSPTHLYTQPGVYTVSLTATDGDCSDGATLTIIVTSPVLDPSSVTVPNVFSPNGDGVNDQLEVESTALLSLEVSILNRWGQVVAELDRVRQSWSGRTGAGEELPEGTYFYVLKAEGEDGKRYDLTGTITLLR